MIEKLFYCPVCGPFQCGFKSLDINKMEIDFTSNSTNYDSKIEYYKCCSCGWIGKKDELWGPSELPREKWVNEQRDRKLKEILD